MIVVCLTVIIAPFLERASAADTIVCADTDHLHTQLTQRLASLPGIGSIETAPLIRLIKRSSHSATVRH
jgi:hypothetical protein